MFNSTGRLNQVAGGWLRAEVSNSLIDYKRRMSGFSLKSPAWGAHITVINQAFDKTKKTDKYTHLINKKIQFSYDVTIKRVKNYFILSVDSTDLENIRESCGLSRKPPWPEGFHITVGSLEAPDFVQAHARVLYPNEREMRHAKKIYSNNASNRNQWRSPR